MNSTELRTFRQNNIKKAQLKANETNKLKGLKRFVISRNKQQKINNDLIDELLLNGYYNKIYNIWIENILDMEDYDYYNDDEEYDDMTKNLSEKDISILNLFNYENPEKLKQLKQGMTIIEQQL